MNDHMTRRLRRTIAGAAIVALAASCGGSPATTAATPAPPAVTAPALATAAAATAAAATTAPAAATAPAAQVLSHKAGTTHAQQPKRLETVIEIDMGDHYFAGVDGVKNPTFTIPAGKTVGLHFHNEGTVLHEFAFGRTAKKDGGYEKDLFEKVKVDVFFYYAGGVKAEVGGATFEEIEMDQGLQDVWLRFNVPAELKGEWEIGCFAPEHYGKGMHAKLIVQ